MLAGYLNRMLTCYDRKEVKKEEERRQEKTRIMIEVEGKRYVSFVDRNSVVKFRDGTKYLVDEHGSLRKIKAESK